MASRGRIKRRRLNVEQQATLARIEEELRRLPADRLAVVLDFLSCLTARQQQGDTRDLLLAAETALREDWDRPEEDAAWAHL